MKPFLSKVPISIKLIFLYVFNGSESPDCYRLHRSSEIYAGKWHEIASNSMSFQKDCCRNITDYTLTNKRHIKIFDSCRKGSVNGKAKLITGKAFPVEGTSNTKLKGQFFWQFKAYYWVIDKADDYSWPVVLDLSLKYLWIKKRTPKMQKKPGWHM